MDDSQGHPLPQAAGKIYTDFEKGFIRAEVVNFIILLLSTAQWRPARRRALSAARERTTSCRTET